MTMTNDEFDYEIDNIVEECDAIRKELEGVGLSDVLVHIVRLAFTQGAVYSSAQSMRIAHGSNNNSDTLGL